VWPAFPISQVRHQPNPHRSIHCQARSEVLFVSLMKRGELESALRSPDAFLETLLRSE
jgi:hypothetical protein